VRDVGGLAERQAPFKHGDCLVQRPLAASEQSNTCQRKHNTIGLFDRLGQLYRLFSQAVPLGEAAQFG